MPRKRARSDVGMYIHTDADKMYTDKTNAADADKNNKPDFSRSRSNLRDL